MAHYTQNSTVMKGIRQWQEALFTQETTNIYYTDGFDFKKHRRKNLNGEGNKKIGIDLAIDLVILKLVFVKTVGTLDYFDFLLMDQAENDHSFC